MRVFVTGATGFIGSAVVPELVRAGHHVVGLARSDASAQALEVAGVEVYRGSLEDPGTLRAAAAKADGVIHLAFIHDFSNYEAAARADWQAVEAMGLALEGSNRPMVIASGLLGFGSGRIGVESDLVAESSRRGRSEHLMLEFGKRGVRSAIVRLAPSVHGAGDHGFVPLLIAAARKHGVSAYVGEGANHWPAVHRLDAARLFRLALEQASGGSVLHAAAEEGVRTREIAEVIGRRLSLPTASKTLEEAPQHWGFLGPIFAMDARASSALTQARFSWKPEHPGLLEDIAGDHYYG